MLDAVRLTEFVENYLYKYGIRNPDYHLEVNEEGDWYSTIFPDGIVTDVAVEKMLVLTGLTREELFGMKPETTEKYDRMFPFFRLDKDFHDKYEAESIFLDIEKTKYFGYQGTINRYDETELKKRIINTMMDIDETVQGSYHPNAFPVGLMYSTEWMISFPKYQILITSLLRMINRYRDLFVGTIKSRLSEEEIREMNFLASALDICDLVEQQIRLTHENVYLLRDVYRKENLHDFYSYIKIGRMEQTKYWRCSEFFDNEKLVKAYINAFPGAFAGMRQYLMRTTHFSCWFYWSDDVPNEVLEEYAEECELIRQIFRNPKDVTQSKTESDTAADNSNETPYERFIESLDDDEYEEHMRSKAMDDDYDYLDDPCAEMIEQEEEIEEKAQKEDFLGTTYIFPDIERKEPDDDKQIHIYVEKEESEQFYNGPYYAKIREAIQPEQKGGLPFPKRECISDKLTLNDGRIFDRRNARLQAIAGGTQND